MSVTRLALAISLLLLATPSAFAEPCAKTSGYSAWTTLGEGSIWSGCTPGTGDDFTISGTAEVVIDGLLAINAGTTTITCGSGATLRITPGSGIDATSATSVTVIIQDGCNFQPQGEVVYKGYVGSTTTHAAGPPATGTISVLGGSPTAVGAAATDLAYFPYPSESVIGRIMTAIQSTTGLPVAGYFKPTGMAGAFASLESLSATQIVYHTNAWVSEAGGTDGGAADPYNGTRGPGNATAAAATVVRTRGGFLTKVQIDLATTTDGDLTDQAVRFTTGTCAGRNPYPIMYTDANASATPDDIYVLGDASECSGGDIVIESAPNIGDPVWIVRPVIFEGGGVMSVFIHGANLAGEWIDFRNLAPKLHPTISHSGVYANIGILKQAAGGSQPTGYLRHVRVAYPLVNASGTDTGALLVMNGNAGLTAYTHGAGETLDLSGLTLSEWHVADQFNLGSGSGGVHGLFAQSTAVVNADRFRVERLGDDGMVWVGGSYGANAPQSIRLREWQVMAANNDGGGGAFSQQCLDLHGGTPATTDLLYGVATVEDSFVRGCDDGVLVLKLLNSHIRRTIAGGSQGAGLSAGSDLNSFSSLPAGAIEDNPNTISHSMLFQLAGTSSSINAINGSIQDSIVAGNVIGSPANGSLLGDVVSIERSLIDLGDDSASATFFDRVASNAWQIVEDIYITDSVLLNSSTGPTPLFTANFATTTATTFHLTRTHIGVDTISAGSGYLDNSDSVFTVAQDLRLSMGTATAGGLRGLGGTALGANVSETCVETTLANALTGAANYGSARTATSIELDDMRPDPANDVPISAYIDAAPSNCEPPLSLGPKQVGFAYSLAGPGITLHPELISTSETLLRPLGGTGESSSFCPFGPWGC